MLTDEVRLHCAAVAASARHITIDAGAEIELEGVAGLDAGLHFLDGPPEEVARYVFILDAINFGSGWFHELQTGTDEITARLTAHAREHGPFTVPELQAMDARTLGGVLGLEPSHRLTGLYAEALNQLGAWLPHHEIGDRAEDLARRLTAMPFFADHGYYKRAQITANDLQLAGVADFGDIHRLTIFADNVVPHVLRLDGVLRYDDELSRLVDERRELPAGGPHERELRACAVHACELLARRAGIAPAVLDNRLWNRGQRPPYSERPAHITKTVFY